MSQQPPQQQDPLLKTLTRALEALTGSAEDLSRAALILRQQTQPEGGPARSPADLRRIADEFSARAKANQAALEAVLTTGRSIVEGATSAKPAAPTATPGSAS